MTKINNNKQKKDVQIHIEKAYCIIENHLPSIYVSLVKEKLSKKGIKETSSSVIRNVRNKTNYRTDVILALVEVALEHKKTIEQLKKLTN